MAPADEGQSGAAPTSNRRNALKLIGGSAVAGMAGCLGGDDGDDGTPTPTADGNGDTTTPGDGTTTAGSGYPDLSGQEVHFLTSDTSDDAQTYWTGVKDDFEAATGATVEIEFGGFADEGIIGRITSLIQAGDPPEVADLGIVPASGFLTEDALATLDDAMDTIIERYGEPTPAKRIVLDGSSYNVPLKSSYLTFWYRGDVNNITPSDFQNTMDYVQDVDENVEGVRGTYYPTGTGLHALLNHMGWAYARGTTLMRRSGGSIESNLQNDSEAWTDVLEYARELYNYSPVSTDSDFGALINAIHTETAASNPYIGVRPKNYSITNEKEWAEQVSPVLGMPDHPEASGTKKTIVGGGGFVSFAGADNEAANEWIKFVTEPDRYIDLFSVFAPVHYTAPWPGLKEMDAYWTNLRDAAAPEWSDEQIRTVQYDIPEETELTNLVNEVDPPNALTGPIVGNNVIEQMFQNVLVQDQEIATVLDETHQEINTMIDEAQG